MKALLVAGLIALSALPAQAVEWQYVAGDERITYFIDTDSIQTDGYNYVYNVKIVDYKNRDISVSKHGMSCQRSVTRIFTISKYTLDGRFLRSLTGNNQDSRILSGSAPEIIFNHLCQ